MKKLFSISILVLIFHIIPNQVFSQQTNKTNLTANITFGHAPDCRGSQGICTFQTLSSNKSISNTKTSFNKESNELTLVLSKTTLDQTSKLKLLSNELEKNFYLYTFDKDFILPKEIKDVLNIKKVSKIKQGNYLVKVIKDQIIMKLKLE